jgi:hypothetical protein
VSIYVVGQPPPANELRGVRLVDEANLSRIAAASTQEKIDETTGKFFRRRATETP